MKKAITILMVLCVSVALFAAAGATVKAGGAFNFVAGSTKDFVYEETTIPETASKYKSSGIGFDVAGSFDLSKELKVWADFNMVFGSDAKFKYSNDDDWTSMDDQYKAIKEIIGDKATKKFYMISAGAGVAYKLNLNAPVDISVGGGVFFERVLGSVGGKKDDTELSFEFKAINLGVSLYADAAYKFSDNFGISLTVMPHIGVYNSSTLAETTIIPGYSDESIEMKAKGVSLSFSMPVAIGATYSF